MTLEQPAPPASAPRAAALADRCLRGIERAERRAEPPMRQPASGSRPLSVV